MLCHSHRVSKAQLRFGVKVIFILYSKATYFYQWLTHWWKCLGTNTFPRVEISFNCWLSDLIEKNSWHKHFVVSKVNFWEVSVKYPLGIYLTANSKNGEYEVKCERDERFIYPSLLIVLGDTPARFVCKPRLGLRPHHPHLFVERIRFTNIPFLF